LLLWLGSTLGAVAVLASDLDEAKRHLEAERYGKALDAAERVLAASPDDPDARAIESAALLGQKRPGRAAERAEAWAGRAPDDPRPLVLLARALGAKEDWVTLRRVAIRVKDAPVETRAPVFREVARQYCGGPGCEVATDLLADLAAIPGQGPEHLLDVALEIASRGERDRALAALERFLETRPPDRDAEFALYAMARSLIRAAERGDPNPPAEGFTIEIPDGSGRVTPPVRVTTASPELPAAARRPDTSGTATLQCVVLRTGHVVPVQVHGGTDRGFTSSSFASLLKWRYEPAKKDGVPVPCTFVVKTSWRTSGSSLDRGF
jgi:hypothetical protein